MEAGHEGRNQEISWASKNQKGFSFDDGLAEQQEPFLTVAIAILAALINLDSPPNDVGEGGGTRPRGGPGDARGCSGSAGQCKCPFECLETATYLRLPNGSWKKNFA